ncbi:hybrid-cluster NAD(P)-dependent oxidoreductase [Microbacter sp. GSS18]|nr:hybrid-cluster NAD(P)-dependent oxidoreductase [Microbacter sp. GSS18]
MSIIIERFGPGAVLAEHDRWDEDPTGRTLTCTRIVRRTDQIATFEFAADDRRALPHAPGQYVTISADIDGERVSRCYTVSSPSTRPYSVQLTVKREATGRMSAWLHDVLAVGDRVELSGPAGEFSTAYHPAERILLLAGGVGITPMMSILESIHDLAEPTDVVLVHNSRSPDLVAFRAELSRLTQDNMRIRVVQAVSMDPDGTWLGPVGRLDAAMLSRNVPDIRDREVFVCGPDAYMEHAQSLALSLGVPIERIHRESFVLTQPEEPAAIDTSAEAGTHSVTFARSGKVAEIAPGQTVLDAAKQAGVRMNSSCRSGLCGTCKIVKVEGEVEMRHNGGIRQREIDAGKILACCSRPCGAVVIDG